jgi:small-conductance mechanosensitive channel
MTTTLLSNFQRPSSGAFWLVIFFIAVSVSHPAYSEQESTPSAPVSELLDARAPEKDLSDLIPYITGLSQRFTDLQRQVDSIFDTSDIQIELVGLSEKLEDLSWDITFMQSVGHYSYDELAYYKKELTWRNQEIREIGEPLGKAVKLITARKIEWMKEQKQLAEWRDIVKTADPATGETKIFENYEETTAKASQLIARQLRPLLAADQKVGELQVKVHALGLEIDKRMNAMRKAVFQKTSPSMISSDFFSPYNRELWAAAWRSATTTGRFRIAVSDMGGWALFPLAAAFAVLSFMIYRSGRFLAQEAKWDIFSRRPVATAVLISAPLFALLFFNLPPVWMTFIRVVTIVAALRLARGWIRDTWKRRIFTQVSAVLLISGVFSMLGLPLALFRLYVFFVSLAGLAFCLWHGWLRVPSGAPAPIVWAFRLGALVLSFVLITEISGYAAFAFFLFSASMRSIFAIMLVWILFVMVGGAEELIFHNFPAPVIQRNAPVIVRGLNPLLAFLFFFYFIATFLVIWRLYATEWEAVLAILSMGFHMGSLKITLGLVLSAVAVLYGAVLASRAVQAVLLQGVLQRSNVEKGVQFSIARLVHYGIVTIGFLMALHALGIGMTNLTILGGALGIGIGFGLQAIVNNFAGGLILLFERPLKVGDTIQIGDQMGEVRNLGLRATVIKTFDSAEIVVPNSDLITGQLTNWTLAERRVRVKIPVGVAYGSDVARVMGLLMSCANENKRVLKDPAPFVLFLAFGASSLDFELRLWIGEFTDRRAVQSEVNQAIELKLRKAGIKIPFPQQDVYLKSLPEAFQSKPETSGGTE